MTAESTAALTAESTAASTAEPTAERTPLVVVSVGTDHHRFDRLVGWMDAWAVSNRSVKVIVQRGTAPSTTVAESQPLIPYGELCALFAEATVVVTHGGPSTVMDARAAGSLPIVVPRDPELGEHVDGHQLAFAEHLGRHGLAIVAENVGELDEAIRLAIDSPETVKVSADEQNGAGIAEFGRVLDDLLGSTTKTIR